MEGLILTFIYGLIWMLMIGVQMRMYSEGSGWLAMFLWTGASSVLWCFMVREINIDKSTTWSYAIGTAIGAVVAQRFRV